MGDCVIEPEQDYRGKTGRDPPAHITKPQNIWPPRAPFMREAMYKYYKAIYPLAMKLVRIMALALDQEGTAFDKYFTLPITGLRALHYPPAPVESEIHTVGLGAHSDFSCTVLPSLVFPAYTSFKAEMMCVYRAHSGPPRRRPSPRSPQQGWHLDRRSPKSGHIHLQRRLIARASHKRQVRRHCTPRAQQVRTGAVFAAVLSLTGSRCDSGCPGLLRG